MQIGGVRIIVWVHSQIKLSAGGRNDIVNLAGWGQLNLEGIAIVLQAIAIFVAVSFYLYQYWRDKRKVEGLKKAILAALKQEIEMNWRLLHNPPLLSPRVNHSEYYDPTRQIFKYPDDAIGLALSRVESDVLLDPDLAQGLLRVRQAVRFVNQQVDELMAFRFGSPDTLAKASDLFRNNPDCIYKFASDTNKIPKRYRAWFQELALRHWAIVNKGYRERLRPSLLSVQSYLDAALQEVGLSPLKMPEMPVAATVFEIEEAPPLSAWGWVESSGSTFTEPSSQVLFVQEDERPDDE